MTLAVAAVAWCVLASIRSTGWTIFLRVPSTLAHELSHWVVALVTRASPSFPSIIPRRDAASGGWVLGSVRFKPSWGSAALIACAPFFILAPLALELGLSTHARTPEQALLQGTALAYLVQGCLPSRVDLKIAIADPVGLALVGLLLAGLYQYYVTLF